MFTRCNTHPLLVKYVTPSTLHLNSLTHERSFPLALSNASVPSSPLNILRPERFVSEFQPVSVLGKGGFGTVLKALKKNDQSLYAVKMIPFRDHFESSSSFNKVFREVMTMKKFDHVNVAKYYSAWLETATEKISGIFGSNAENSSIASDQSGSKSFDRITVTNDNLEQSISTLSDFVPVDSNGNSLSIADISPNQREKETQHFLMNSNEQKSKQEFILYIQMQLYSGRSLKAWLSEENRVIDPQMNLMIFQQILDGLQHIHDCGVIHRDLKPANILFSDEGVVKIVDFGLAKQIDELIGLESHNDIFGSDLNQSTPSYTHTQSIGTPGYVAPEVLSSNSYGTSVDIYSLGVILLELFCVTATKHERARLLSNLRQRELPEDLYPSIKSLILDMTEPEADNRPSLTEISQRIHSVFCRISL